MIGDKTAVAALYALAEFVQHFRSVCRFHNVPIWIYKRNFSIKYFYSGLQNPFRCVFNIEKRWKIRPAKFNACIITRIIIAWTNLLLFNPKISIL
jgi:hypothetical protein